MYMYTYIHTHIYICIYEVTLVPTDMAVNGVFRVRGGGTGVLNLCTSERRKCGGREALLLSP